MSERTIFDMDKQRLATDPQGVIINKDIPNKTTKDLYLAAALHCEGCRLLGLDKTDPRRIVFIFAGGELADRVEREWYADVLVVSASRYASSIRMCKSAIHN